MSVTTLLAWTITICSLTGLLWTLIRMLLRTRQSGGQQVSDFTEDTAPFSIDRYEPMARLLSGEDLLFLQLQPGYCAEMGERWKRESRQVFRIYLRELKADFRRLHRQARELIAYSGADSAGLMEVLLKQQFTFWRATSALEFRLALQWAGIGKVEIAPLLQTLEAMRLDLAQRTYPVAI